MTSPILRFPQVRTLTGLSRTTIFRHERANDFPARVQLGRGGAVGWYESEVAEWLASRPRVTSKHSPAEPIQIAKEARAPSSDAGSSVKVATIAKANRGAKIGVRRPRIPEKTDEEIRTLAVKREAARKVES